MKNILLISFALLFVGGCSESSNPVADDTSSVKCTESGCSATGCAADCACGCGGAGNCDCATNCTCVNEDEDDDSSTANAVSIADGAFNPSTLTIAVGETVTWTLTSGTHTVVSDEGSSETWDSDSIASGGIFSHQFDTAGEFGYHCGIHSSMTGIIEVEAE